MTSATSQGSIFAELAQLMQEPPGGDAPEVSIETPLPVGFHLDEVTFPEWDARASGHGGEPLGTF